MRRWLKALWNKIQMKESPYEFNNRRNLLRIANTLERMSKKI